MTSSQAIKKIFTMGGGGFSMEPENHLLDEYILSLVDTENPRICFIPTASHDAIGYIDRFFEFFTAFRCKTSVARIWSDDIDTAKKCIWEADILYVGGGNTDEMLKRWKETGTIEIIRNAYDQGKLITGISAGSLCWFEWGVTDSFGSDDFLECLGWIKGSNCVHYQEAGSRAKKYRELIESGHIGGMALEDGVGTLYLDGALANIVSSRPDANAYDFSASTNGINKRVIHPNFLGNNESGVVIHRSGTADAEGIHDAHMRSIQGVCAKSYRTDQIHAWMKPFDRLLLEKLICERPFWTVKVDGKIEGFGNMIRSSKETETMYIHGLYLSDKAIGRGIGRRLYNGMERFAWEEGCSKLRLHSTVNAKPFYERMGFETCGPNTAHQMRGVDVECIPMEKFIS